MYASKTEALQDLMNRGYLIYQDPTDKTWTIQKIATSYDPNPGLPISNETRDTRQCIRGGIVRDRLSGFETQTEALEKVIAWIDEGPQETRYAVEAMFNDGLGPKFRTIGEVAASTTMEADTQARELGERYFTAKKVKWDVRIRPVTDNTPHWM